ncbi:MAG: hypothetical protein E7182_04530 [Erysipelotrichaceae bacterium]|nr:hypothetical protein [Erysipelotrichaceae bacterium]
MIQWFNVKDRSGVASFYPNNITLNTTAMYPFDTAFKVQVGLDENKNVVIMPLSKETVESGVLDECCLLKIEMHKSFARISSSVLLRQIAEELGLELSKKPIQFATRWDSVENVLIVDTKERR